VVELVLAYYVLLRAIVRAQPELRRCRTRCRHCGIWFFTHPRNAGRHDLGCPFGCREVHRKLQSSRRSTAYYQDAPGKEKKRQQNAKRRPVPVPAPGPAVATPWPRPLVAYVRLAASLIEKRWVGWAEVVQMLTRVVRQHRMVRRRRIEHVVAQLYEHPP